MHIYIYIYIYIYVRRFADRGGGSLGVPAPGPSGVKSSTPTLVLLFYNMK